jgi:hypothetical protein
MSGGDSCPQYILLIAMSVDHLIPSPCSHSSRCTYRPSEQSNGRHHRIGKVDGQMSCLLKPRIDGPSATIPAALYAKAADLQPWPGIETLYHGRGHQLALRRRCYFFLMLVYMTQRFGPLHEVLQHLPCGSELYPRSKAVRKPLTFGGELNIRNARLPTMVKTFLKACLLWAKGLPWFSEACFSTRLGQKRKVVVELSRIAR